MIFPECDRCKHQKPETLVFHSNPLISFGGPQDFITVTPPQATTVCADCLTDYEVAQRLRGIIIFCLGAIQSKESAREKQDVHLIGCLSEVRTRLAFESGPYRNYELMAREALKATLREIADDARMPKDFNQCPRL